jgi:hypothetical protein
MKDKKMKISTKMRVLVVCSICRYQYVDGYGFSDERRRHARFHAAYLKPRRPVPDLRLAAYKGDVRVDGTSPGWLNRVVYRCARALQRDECYDFPQWDEDRPPKMRAYERDLHALLLIENDTIPVGVVGFVWTNWSNVPAGWHMFMASIADEWRRKGVMSRRWPAWRQTYGDFTHEQLNEAMGALIRKMAAA